MGANVEVNRLHQFLADRNIPTRAPHNPDMILPGIDYVTSHPDSILVSTRSYRGKLGLAIEFSDSPLGLNLDVRRQGTYRELERWRRKTGADWPEHLVDERVKVAVVLIGRHGLFVVGLGIESNALLRINIDLKSGRVSKSSATPVAGHSLAV